MKILKTIVVVACSIVLLSGCKVLNAPGAYVPAEGKQPVKEVVAQQPQEQPAPAVEEPAPAPAVEEPVAAVIEEKEVTRAEVFSVIEGENEADLKAYHVVIGSFKNQDNAKRLQASMRPDYQPIIVINEQGMYRVLLASFDDYASAKRKITDIRAQFNDAWVLVQKK